MIGTASWPPGAKVFGWQEHSGVLTMAAAHGLVNLANLAEAFERIKHTNFYYRQEVMDQFLADASREEQ